MWKIHKVCVSLPFCEYLLTSWQLSDDYDISNIEDRQLMLDKYLKTHVLHKPLIECSYNDLNS